MTDAAPIVEDSTLPALRPLDPDALLRADPFTRYLAEMRRYPLLDPDEEHAAAEAFYKHGDVEAGRRLVTGNLRLVVKIAMEYRRAWVQVMDLVQEGNIGLSEAVKRFDPYRGVRFGSFARYWIRALMLQFILKNFRMISFANTRAGRKLFFRLEKERARLMHEVGEATPRLLAESLDVSVADVEAAEQLRKPTLSLTAPRGDGETRTLSDVIHGDERPVDVQVAHADLMSVVDEKMRAFRETLVDERERAIWDERLLAEDPVALAVLGERFDVSRERIRQVEARIKERLKAYLTDEMGTEFHLDFRTDDA